VPFLWYRRAEDDLEAAAFQIGFDLGAALGVAGDDERDGGWRGIANGGGDPHFFAGMCAGGENDRACGTGARQALQQRLKLRPAGWWPAAAWIDFQAAGGVNLVRGYAELLPDGGVIRVLDGHRIEHAEEGADPCREAQVARAGARREPGVGEADGDLAAAAGEQQVRPDFALDKDELRRLEMVQVAADHAGKIQRGIGDPDAGELGGGGDGMAGGGAGGQHEALVGRADAPFADELEGEHGFADAYGMEVDGAARFVVERGGVEGRPLAQAGAEAAAAQHFDQPSGKRRQKEQRQQQPVDR